MRAPSQRVRHAGYRRGAKDAGIGLSDQGRPASWPATTADAARENLRKLVRGAAAAGARKSPALRWTAASSACGNTWRTRQTWRWEVQTVATIDLDHGVQSRGMRLHHPPESGCGQFNRPISVDHEI
jgi:hypothetical protein